MKWTREAALNIIEQPFNDLLLQAHQVHRANFDPNTVQISTLLSIKTGGCPENCAYCPQSAHYDTGVVRQKLMSVDDVIIAAKKAKSAGATRFCMGAGWRQPRDKDLDNVIEMIKAIKALEMETCVTLGMLTQNQVDRLEVAGLDFYNHNLDSSPEFYEKIIQTRQYQERLDTLKKIGKSNIKTCCGGILGMGETIDDRIGLLLQLTQLDTPPESVPINMLIRIPGTPLENAEKIDPISFIRMIALTRIMLPTSMVRLSAGRAEFSDEMHALAFFAGANSIHYGEKLLVTETPDTEHDQALFRQLGINHVVGAIA